MGLALDEPTEQNASSKNLQGYEYEIRLGMWYVCVFDEIVFTLIAM